ncbi:MAG: DUF4215 domain-containing protein [Nannocystaceae bacterium]
MARVSVPLLLRSATSARFDPRWALLAVLPASLPGADASAAVVPAELVARESEVPLGTMAAVSSISPPFALADGTVAFSGTVGGADGYVFIDDQVVWLNSDELVQVLTGVEASMGASLAGGYVYSPMVDGEDAVWTHNGLLAVEGVQAPALPVGVTTTFHSRPSMTSGGAAYWIAGINASGGTVTEDRVLYRSPTALAGDVEVVLASGDLVGSLAIDSPDGIDFDYQVSADGVHLIAVLNMDTGSGFDDGHIYLDGLLLHQEDTPNGTGDDWDNFDLVAVNNAGTYVFSGDTNGGAGTDEFIAVDGVIAIREGDVVDGITLGSSAFVRFISVAEDDRIAHAWNYVGGAGQFETVFYACDPADVAGSSRAVLTTGVDELDLDGDGLADALVTDLLTSTASPSKVLTNDGFVYLEVDLEQGGVTLESMVRVPVTCCGNLVVDDGEQCDDGNGDDTDACPGTCQDAFCGDGFTWAGMEDCDDGNVADTDACLSTCEPASCGDGFLWAGVEGCDDGNVDDTDACPSTCEPATCGDGFVQLGVEGCDDGNDDDTDACLSTCISATCGDGIVQDGVETCDDGNDDDTDACPGNCLDATCGDGFLQADREECDDGNTEDGDGCDADCTVGRATGDGSGEGSSTGDTGVDPTDSGSGTGAVDDTGADTSGGVATLGATGTGSTGDTDGPGPFPGLDDDGGCTCRAEPGGDHGRGGAWLALLLLGLRRRRS